MSKTALIVDDSKMASLAIKRALEGAEFTNIHMIEQGDLALEKYKEVNPDLVTMDLNMPGTDGINATRQILSYDKNAKIIVITELQLSEDKKKELDGVLEIVMKPVTVAKIEAALTRL